MEYENINGWNISKITLGTVQLGMEYGIANKSGKPSLEKAFEILDVATEGGINSFDTANKYGESEQVLGKYFSSPRCKIRNPLLTTKFALDPSKGTDRDSVEKQIYMFVESSLEKLNITKIPIYMLHNPKDMSQYGDVVVKALKKLVDEGLIGKVGVSVYHPEEVEEMLKEDFYEAVQVPMNVFDLRMLRSGVLEKLRTRNKIVFVRSIYFQGLFFMELDAIPNSLEPIVKCIKELHQLAEMEGISVAQLAFSFIRDVEGVTSLVVGAETPEQVAENIRLMKGPKLSSDTTGKIEKLAEKVSVEMIMKELHARWRR